MDQRCDDWQRDHAACTSSFTESRASVDARAHIAIGANAGMHARPKIDSRRKRAMLALIVRRYCMAPRVEEAHCWEHAVSSCCFAAGRAVEMPRLTSVLQCAVRVRDWGASQWHMYVMVSTLGPAVC